MTRPSLSSIALLIGLLLSAAGCASMQGAGGGKGALDRIKASRSIALGYRQSSVPFSAIGSGGKPVGYSIDLCTQVASDVGRELQIPDLAIKWVPVDYWCAKNLDAMRSLLQERIAPGIGAHETWALQVEKRGWARYHTAEIIERLAAAIDRKVRLKAPDKRVRVDILRDTVAVSLLRPGEVFSIYAPAPPPHA